MIGNDANIVDVNQKLSLETLPEEMRRILPPLSSEQCIVFSNKKLGFDGFSQDGNLHAMLIPTPLSPNYWIWCIQDLNLKIEEYSYRAMACSRIPWNRFKEVEFEAVPMNARWEYWPAINIQRNKSKPIHLYVIQSIVGGPVKIGVSNHPEARVAQLQAGNAFPLQVIRIYAHQGKWERHIHEMLKDHKLHGEWFAESTVNLLDEMMPEEV